MGHPAFGFVNPEEYEEHQKKMQERAESRIRTRLNFIEGLDRDDCLCFMQLMYDVATAGSCRVLANWYVGYSSSLLSTKHGVDLITQKTADEMLEDL